MSPSRGQRVGLVLLTDDDSIDAANPSARELIDDLGPGAAGAERPPIVIRAVASRARSAAASETPDQLARATARTRSGRWLVVRASMLGDGPAARVAVTLEPMRSPELAPSIAAAYGLTERERAVTQLVAQGLRTHEIAHRLHLSPWTVQDHLKAIFAKTGVGSRGELVSRLFFDHYAPRLPL